MCRRLGSLGGGIVAGGHLKFLHCVYARRESVAAVLPLRDHRVIQSQEVVVASLAVHIKALRRWIDLDGVKRISVHIPARSWRQARKFQKVAAIEGKGGDESTLHNRSNRIRGLI